jgi:hypothetical protein
MLKKLKSGTRDLVLNYKKLTMCKKCYTFYYKNSWHFEMPGNIKESPEQEIPVLFLQCPSCLEDENASYEMESKLVFT